MSATLLERSVFADETGAGIQLGPNATRVLAELGVLDAVEAVAFKPDLLRLFDGQSGGTLTSVPLGSVAERALRRALSHLSPRRPACCVAGSLPRPRCHRPQRRLRRDGGREPCRRRHRQEARTATQVEGSSLIAADGIWSRLRDRIAPHADLRFSGATAWRALLPRDQVPAPFDAPSVGLWLGPRAHLVHYPVRGGKDVNIVAVVEGGSAKQGWNLRAEPDVLLPAFHRWASPAQGVARECRELALLVAVPAEAIAPLDERARGAPR